MTAEKLAEELIDTIDGADVPGLIGMLAVLLMNDVGMADRVQRRLIKTVAVKLAALVLEPGYLAEGGTDAGRDTA